MSTCLRPARPIALGTGVGSAALRGLGRTGAQKPQWTRPNLARVVSKGDLVARYLGQFINF